MLRALAAQGDFVAFVSLFACVVSMAQALVLHREDGPSRRWHSYVPFYLCQALVQVLTLLAPVFLPSPVATASTAAAVALAFGSLLAFMPVTTPRPGLRATVAGLAALAAAGLALLSLAHPAAADLGTAVLLAVPGTVFAVMFMLRDPAVKKPGRPWLVTHALFLSIVGLLAVVKAAAGILLPGRGATTGAVVHAAVFLALALTLALHSVRNFARVSGGFGRPFTRIAIAVSLSALPVTLLLGLLVSMSLGNRARADVLGDYEVDLSNLRQTLEQQDGETDRETILLAASDAVVGSMAHPGPARRADLDAVLIRFKGLTGSDCFILGRGGEVAATSAPALAAFIDASSADKSWLEDGLVNGGGRTFVGDPMSGAARYVASAPIWDAEEGIVGVAVMMRPAGALFPAINAGQVAFLLDPGALVVDSSSAVFTGRNMWPFPSGEGGSVTATPGARRNPDSRALLDERPLPGSTIRLQGTSYLVTSSYLSVPGWSILDLGPLTNVLVYRLAGLAVTLIVTLILSLFSATGQASLLDEARVERSESLYRTLVEGTPDWISIIDASGTFQFTNTAGRRLLGLSASPAVPVESVLGVEHVNAIAGLVHRAIAGTVTTVEKVLPGATGDAIVCRLTVLPLAGRDGAHALLIGNDITETRKTEARLLRAERLAALGTLTAGLAHQFNNINTVAMSYLGLLARDPSVTAEARGHAAAVRKAVERSVDITTRLMPLSVTGSRSRACLLLSDAVREAADAFFRDTGESASIVTCRLDDEAMVSLAREQLVFIVQALLSNAFHATIGQGTRQITVSTGVDGDSAFLSVADTGVGLTDGDLKSLFTPFYSQKGEHAPPGSPLSRVRGVGLSLAVVQSIVTGCEGRIDVASTPGAGSTFTVWLPCGSEELPA